MIVMTTATKMDTAGMEKLIQEKFNYDMIIFIEKKVQC